MTVVAKTFPLPGFEALNDQVYMLAPGSEPTPPSHPKNILIFGWGDGLPKHVAKYAAGYVALYPHSRHFVCISPISKAMFLDIDRRGANMNAIIDNLTLEMDETSGNPVEKPSVLVHCMSNTGAIFYSALLHHYRKRFDTPFPHNLIVLDSTPGSPFLAWDTLKRWSRAMALGMARFFPWPFVFTQSICGVLLLLNYIFSKLKGGKAAGAQALEIVDDEKFEHKDAKRLYLYSKEDNLISHKDIESFADESEKKGYVLKREVFTGSDHVDHMRLYPHRYWRVIDQAWKWTAGIEAESK